ncbi:hypothetical protein WR25_26852 [Diploscapter pachys]|uniref:Uncharacterized protein n=1 Tax=Diploscapter pachys TaxID=2018661 RepID=A0A2A2M403_9BILA|nr:hypothetical protein WR25_26852 [Diploscapter pachys]
MGREMACGSKRYTSASPRDSSPPPPGGGVGDDQRQDRIEEECAGFGDAEAALDRGPVDRGGAAGQGGDMVQVDAFAQAQAHDERFAGAVVGGERIFHLEAVAVARDGG